MAFFSVLSTGLALLAVANAQCLDSYNIYEIFSSPGSTKTYTTNGERTLSVSEVNVQDCATWAANPTGKELDGKTIISYDAAFNPDNGKCRVNNSTGENHWFTFQGFHVQANGWKIQPQDLELSDIDIENGLTQDTALRKSSIVFGYNGNQLVWPTYTIPFGSLLRTQQFWIKAPQMALMGFPAVDQFPYGVMWGQLTPHVSTPFLFDCTTDQTQCTAVASFSEPVDGFLVLFAGERKSDTVREAKMTVGALKSPCGCRCEASAAGTQRVVTKPVIGVPGECSKTTATTSALSCVPTGPKWCESSTKPRYVTLGAQLPNGNYPCGQSTYTAAWREVSDFP